MKKTTTYPKVIIHRLGPYTAPRRPFLTLFRWAISPLSLLLATLILLNTQAHAAVHTWSGNGVNANWSTAANWSSGGVPAVGEVGLELVFPASVPFAKKNSVDNLPGLVVDVMTVDGGNYHFFGLSGASLTFSGKAGFNFLATNTTASSDQINTFDSSLPLVIALNSRFKANWNVEIQSVISGPGGLALDGRFYFMGTAANTYQGTTTIEPGGRLFLSKTAGVNCFAGPLLVNAGYVENFANSQIPDTVSVTLQNAGTYHNSDFTEKLGPLTLEGGVIGDSANGGNIVTLLNGVNVTGENNVIHSKVSLGGFTRTLSVAAGARLDVYGSIAGGGATGGITKTGLGDLYLYGVNSYPGETLISAGQCIVDQAFALGNTTGGTTVAAGASLYLQEQGNTGALLISNETLNLAGTVFYQTNVTWTGPIILIGNASKFEGNSGVGGVPFDLTLTGVLSGTGQFAKMGSGRLDLLGSAENTYSGGTFLNQGDVYLGNSNFTDSIPGSLIINAAFVSLVAQEQINDNAAVSIIGVGTLDLGSRTETIGSLASGPDAKLHIALGMLITGQNSTSTIFAGKLTGASNVSIIKNGFGSWKLTKPADTNTLTGKVYVSVGTLTVDSTEYFDVIVEPNGLLDGIGTVASITNTGGKVCLCTLHSGNITMTGLASQIITSLDDTTTFDHISVIGTIKLTGSTLYASLPLGYAPYSDSTYQLIDNDGTDPIVGTFIGLSEGQLLLISGKTFRISYVGGSGNDVVLTMITPGRLRPKITQFTVVPDGATNHIFHLEVTSAPNTPLKLYYSTDLLTWTAHPGQSGTSDAQGHFTFSALTPNVSHFFYRVESQ
jgi:fibronectin-binding autotransporter adhesin